jgi:uncharacterized protein YkwD
MKKIFLILSIPLFQTVALAGYGDVAEGYPNWEESVLLVLVNECRMAPQEFRNRYLNDTTVLLPQNYSAVNPLYWNLDLNKSARFHSQDMAINCDTLIHNSCDGTSAGTRIKSFYKSGNSWGENIAFNSSNPLSVIKLWLLESTRPPYPLDGTADGHRKNIMNSTFFETGFGISRRPSDNAPYWTEDFGNGTSAFSNIPISAASHYFFKNTEITFMANVFTKSIAQSVSVILDGTSCAMSLDMGTISKGTYTVTFPRVNSCRKYHFLVKTADNVTWRYPAEGELVTYGEGNCIDNYQPALEAGPDKKLSKGKSVPTNSKHDLWFDLQGKRIEDSELPKVLIIRRNKNGYSEKVNTVKKRRDLIY